MKALEVHRRALDCWKTIPDGIKEKWNGFASVVEPHKPPFDGSSHITGHNLFVSAYHGFAILGNEHIPEPVPMMKIPDEAWIGLYNYFVELYTRWGDSKHWEDS